MQEFLSDNILKLKKISIEENSIPEKFGVQKYFGPKYFVHEY